DVAEAMRELTGEIISLAGAEDARRAADREFDASAHDDTALLAPVGEHLLAGRGAGGVTLVQQCQLSPGALRGDEAQRDLGVSELDQIPGTIEGLGRGAQVQGEELGERHRYTVEHLLERAHRGTHAVLLDERNEAVRDPRAARELALRQGKAGAYAAQ